MRTKRKAVAALLATIGSVGILASCAGESRPDTAPSSGAGSSASGSVSGSGTTAEAAAEATPAPAFGPDQSVANVAAALREFTITTPTTEVPAGKVFVTATNFGEDVHEIVITHAGAPDEEGAIAEADEIAPGQTKAVAADLAPGRYQFACYIKEEENGTVEDHYQLGMVHQFEVK